MLYYDAALRRRRRQRAENLVDSNQAFAGGEGAKSWMKQLESD